MDQAKALIELTADIVSAHVSNNHVAVDDVATLVGQIHQALLKLSQPTKEMTAPKKNPVVSTRASIKPEYLVCMECGKKQKTLKRHLQTAHQLTPEQYRADYALSNDYPMVASDYSKHRSEMAHQFGLGRQKKAATKPKGIRKPKAETPNG